MNQVQFLHSHGVDLYDAELLVEAVKAEYPGWRNSQSDAYVKKYTTHHLPFTLEYSHANNRVFVHLSKLQQLGSGRTSTVTKTVDLIGLQVYAHKKPIKSVPHMPLDKEYQIYERFKGASHVVQAVQRTRFGILLEFMNAGDLQKGGGRSCEKPSIMKQLLLGVEEIHARGYVHRDLKPSNFLCNRMPDGELVVKIGDLELAVPENSKNIPMAGFMDYCSTRLVQIRISEYFEGRPIYMPSRGDDIHAIAVSMLEIMDGKRPQVCTTIHNIMRSMEYRKITSVKQLVPRIGTLRRQLCDLECQVFTSNRVAALAIQLMLGKVTSFREAILRL